ncbi:MAG TPA: hypothetical protein VI036_15840 [Propionibacteriaceae bacterium]
MAGAAGAGGALLGADVGADAAESPEHPASASSNVVTTATKSRFMIISPGVSSNCLGTARATEARSAEKGQHMRPLRRYPPRQIEESDFP